MTGTLIGQIVSGVVTLGLAYIGYLRLKATTASKSDVSAVHTLVNNQRARQFDRNAQLTASLTAAGVVVPEPPGQVQ